MFIKFILHIFFTQIFLQDNLPKTSKEKYRLLLEKTLNSKDGVIYLTELEAHRYLIQHPRNYDLVIMFSTKECKMCQEILSQFCAVSQAYKEKQMYLPRRSKNHEEIKKPIFFLIVELVFQDRILSDRYLLKTLPSFLYSLPSEIYIIDDYKRKQYLDQYFWRLSAKEGIINSQVILTWLSRISSNQEIIIKQSFWSYLLIVSVLFVFLLFLSFLYFTCQNCILHEKFWLFGSLLIFFLFAGGTYSALQQNAPFIGVREGIPEFILKGSRTQYGIEGFIFSGVSLFISLLLILMEKFLKTKINWFIKGIFLGVFLLLLIQAVAFIETIFQTKNFYNPSFIPPAYYVKGGYIKDQGIIQ